MSPLDAIMRPLANVLNRNIRATTPARELCEKLEGTVVAVRVRDTALATWFIVHKEHLEITAETDKEPDILISGSLSTLARMAGAPGVSGARNGSLEFSGDPHQAEEFQRLLNFAKPDLEEELSAVVGDVAAHRIGEVARGLGKWGRDASAVMGANLREYLQEESRDVPSRYEVDRFSKRVGSLRDDIDRLEARIKRLRANR